MRPGEVHAPALVDHPRLQDLGELDQELHAIRRARRAVGDDHRVLRRGEQPRRLLHRARIALRRRGRHVARDIRLAAAVVPHRLLLEPGVERDRHRSVGRGHRDLVGANEGLREVLQRDRRVVPLGEIAHQRVDVLRRVERRHVGRPRRGVEVVAADHDHRHAVAPGVVDRHRRVLEPDDVVHRRGHRLALGARVAVRHRDGDLLVLAEDHLRHMIAAVVDERIVQAAKRRAGIERDVLDLEGLHHVDDHVRPVLGARLLGGHRRFGCFAHLNDSLSDR